MQKCILSCVEIQYSCRLLGGYVVMEERVMHRSQFFPILFQPAKKGLVLIVLLVFIFSGAFFLRQPAAATTFSHTCAPDVPPAVSGTAIPAPAIPGIVKINEVLSLPQSNWNCAEASTTYSVDTDSWIELYNPQKQPLDLFTAQAEISLDGGTNWSMLPDGSIISPGGFLVFFPPALAHHALLSAAWHVVLFINFTTIDQVTTPVLEPDQSYAHIPDGSNLWQSVAQPTIGMSNNGSAQSVTPTSTLIEASIPSPTSTPSSPSSSQKTAIVNSVSTSRASSSDTQPAWSQLAFPPV